MFVALLLGCVLAAALLLDETDVLDGIGAAEVFERDIDQLVVPAAYSVPESSPEIGTWFCPGGSAPGGRAGVSLEIINASVEPIRAVVSGIRSGIGTAPTDALVTVEAGGRSRVPLADLVADSEWMGAVVEVDAADVIVEQTYLGASGTTDRALCHTRTSDLWVAASGATELAARGEEMLLLLLNPFPHDAVLDIRFHSDVGVDTLNGVVVPARRVAALEVNEVVPAASRVSAVIDVVVGRIAASRVQSQGLVTDADHGFPLGLSVVPLASTTAPLWHLLDLDSADHVYVVSVVNPSPDQTAEVDLEIISSEGLSRDPIELTIAPGAVSQVRLSDVSRLNGLGSYGIAARSLTGLPIAVMHESIDRSAEPPLAEPPLAEPPLAEPAPDGAVDGGVDGAVDGAVGGGVDGAVGGGVDGAVGGGVDGAVGGGVDGAVDGAVNVAVDGGGDGAVGGGVDGAVDGAVGGGESVDPGPAAELGPEIVSVAATTGLDVSSTRWLAPLDGGSHSVVIFNPSAESIATVEVAVLDERGRSLVASIEVAPRRRVSLAASELGFERPIVEVVSRSPVVVSRDLVGVSQHQLLPGVVAAEPLPADAP